MEKTSTISDLYCFALVLTKDTAEAVSFVQESVQEILKKRKESGESTRRMRWLVFQKIREKALRQTSEALKNPPLSGANSKEGESSLSPVVLALHVLSEPSRSAMTLFCLESFSLQDLESFLDLSTQELAEALEIARIHLKGLFSSNIANSDT